MRVGRVTMSDCERRMVVKVRATNVGVNQHLIWVRRDKGQSCCIPIKWCFLECQSLSSEVKNCLYALYYHEYKMHQYSHTSIV